MNAVVVQMQPTSGMFPRQYSGRDAPGVARELINRIRAQWPERIAVFGQYCSGRQIDYAETLIRLVDLAGGDLELGLISTVDDDQTGAVAVSVVINQQDHHWQLQSPDELYRAMAALASQPGTGMYLKISDDDQHAVAYLPRALARSLSGLPGVCELAQSNQPGQPALLTTIKNKDKT